MSLHITLTSLGVILFWYSYVMNHSIPQDLSWRTIEENINDITNVTGGFSPAKRGLVHLPSGGVVFIKIGVNDSTKQWAKKEVAVYRFLEKHSFPYIPKLLATNSDETAFALEALTEDWDWTDTWTNERLNKTFESMDVLASIKPKAAEEALFKQKTISEKDDGWGPLATSAKLQAALKSKLQSVGLQDLAELLDFSAMANRSAHFTFRSDVLVHNDVRSDNCAWNAKTGEVKLVDWNWTQIADLRIDTAALLVHAKKAGLDIAEYEDRLDSDALHWIAGFWFRSAATPIWPNGPDNLRDFQLRSGITALSLADKLLR